MDMAIMIVQLPYRFSKLEIDHFTEGPPEAMTARSELIKANGNTLSSPRIHIFAGMFGFLSLKMMLLIVIQRHGRHGYCDRAATPAQPRWLFHLIRTDFGHGAVAFKVLQRLHLYPLNP